MKTIKRREIDINKYVPIAGKLLIRPYKLMTRMVETTEWVDDEELDQEANSDPMKGDLPAKKPIKVKTKAPWEVQLAEVVAIGENTDYKVGDTVVFSLKYVKDFDLFKDVLLMSAYDLYGKYDTEDTIGTTYTA